MRLSFGPSEGEACLLVVAQKLYPTPSAIKLHNMSDSSHIPYPVRHIPPPPAPPQVVLQMKATHQKLQQMPLKPPEATPALLWIRAIVAPS